MLIIDNGQLLRLALGEAIATSQCQIYTAHRTVTTSAFTPGNETQTSSGTGNVTIVDDPGAAGTQKIVDYLSVFNADTIAHTVTIQEGTSGTILYRGYLLPGELLTYTDSYGWRIEQSYKPMKSFTVHGDAGANFAMTNATLAERFAGNTTRHLFMVDLLGYTQVRLRANKMVVGTAGSLFRAKYFTSYNTTVTNFLQLGASAQVEASLAATGYFDSGWMDMALGARNDGICIGFTELGGDGVADPALGATDILFR